MEVFRVTVKSEEESPTKVLLAAIITCCSEPLVAYRRIESVYSSRIVPVGVRVKIWNVPVTAVDEGFVKPSTYRVKKPDTCCFTTADT